MYNLNIGSMKRIQILAILLILIMGIFTGCSKKEFIIKAKLSGIEFDEVSLVSMSDYISFDKAEIDIEGNFELVAKGLKEGEYILKFTDNEKVPVFISKSGALNLDINYVDYKFNVKYEGDNSDESIFIYNVRNKQDEIISRFSQNINDLNIAEVNKSFNTLSLDLADAVNSFQTKNEKLKKIYQELVPYVVALLKIKYETNLRDLSEGGSYEIPQGFNDYKKIINLNNYDVVEYTSYIEFIRLFFRFEIIHELLKGNGKYNIADYCGAYLKEFKNKVVPQRTKDIVLFTGIRYFMHDLIFLNADSIVKIAIKDISDKNFRKELKNVYDLSKKTEYILSGGVEAPNWTAKDIKGNDVSLSSFKGHYVFVEIWATWCAPCIQELPYFCRLAFDYRSKNIFFVSISIDTNIQDWKEFIANRQGEVTHLINTDGFKAKFMRDYGINGVPKFMLFDPLGKVVDVKMSYPSDKLVTVKLDKLLN